MFGSLTPVQRFRRRIEDVLVGLGLAEIYTPSLVPTVAEPGGLTLPDPVGDQATLRTTLLHGLVEAARRNAAVGNDELAFFEIARVYLPRSSDLPDEQVRVAALVEGGFARAKGVVEALYGALKVELAVEPTERPFLYPGRAARTRGRLARRAPPGAARRTLGRTSSSTWICSVPRLAIRSSTRTCSRSRP